MAFSPKVIQKFVDVIIVMVLFLIFRKLRFVFEFPNIILSIGRFLGRVNYTAFMVQEEKLLGWGQKQIQQLIQVKMVFDDLSYIQAVLKLFRSHFLNLELSFSLTEKFNVAQRLKEGNFQFLGTFFNCLIE